MLDKSHRIYIAGHTGMIGAAIVRKLNREGRGALLLCPKKELDLTDQSAVRIFFRQHRPDYVIFAAGKVGSMYSNRKYGADFLYENLAMSINVIRAAFEQSVRRLIFVSCSSVYPKTCPQPMAETAILSSPLDENCEPFAIAKIAAMKFCSSLNRQYGTDYISVIPTNVYGPGQNYDPFHALVIPSLLRKFYLARQSQSATVKVLGTGSACRDFIHADDVADAIWFLANEEIVGHDTFNIGTGVEQSISKLARTIAELVGFDGVIEFDSSHPDGVMHKLQDLSRISRLGWRHKIDIRVGLRNVLDLDLVNLTNAY